MNEIRRSMGVEHLDTARVPAPGRWRDCTGRGPCCEWLAPPKESRHRWRRRTGLRLLRSEASVDDEGGPGHVARVIRGEECDRVGDLFLAALAAHRNEDVDE